MSIQILKKIQDKEKKRQELLSQLVLERKMVKGSFCQIFVKCGRKQCWCYSAKGHPHKRMSLHENGKNYSRAVPVEDHAWMEEMTESYRKYRLMRRQMNKLEKEIKGFLDQQEEKSLKQTKKGKAYLEIVISKPMHEKSSEP